MDQKSFFEKNRIEAKMEILKFANSQELQDMIKCEKYYSHIFIPFVCLVHLVTCFSFAKKRKIILKTLDGKSFFEIYRIEAKMEILKFANSQECKSMIKV